jgi:hypothetical protein
MFEKISCLKNWGVFKNELEKIKKKLKIGENQVLEKDNQFFIIKN